jgi:hypothetical protein
MKDEDLEHKLYCRLQYKPVFAVQTSSPQIHEAPLMTLPAVLVQSVPEKQIHLYTALQVVELNAAVLI